MKGRRRLCQRSNDNRAALHVFKGCAQKKAECQLCPLSLVVPPMAARLVYLLSAVDSRWC